MSGMMSGIWFVPALKATVEALRGDVVRLSAIVADLSGRCERLEAERHADAALVEKIERNLAALAEELRARAAAAGRQAEDFANARETLDDLVADRARAAAEQHERDRQMQDMGESVGRLQLRVAGAETQRIWDSEEMQRTATGLFEHIERLRRSVHKPTS